MKGRRSLASQNPLGSTRKFHNWGLMQKPGVERGSLTSGSPRFDHFLLTTTLGSGFYYYSHFKDGEPEPLQRGDAAQGPTLAGSRTGIQTQIYPAGFILCQEEQDRFCSCCILGFVAEARSGLGLCFRSHIRSVTGSPAGAADWGAGP